MYIYVLPTFVTISYLHISHIYSGRNSSQTLDIVYLENFFILRKINQYVRQFLQRNFKILFLRNKQYV